MVKFSIYLNRCVFVMVKISYLVFCLLQKWIQQREFHLSSRCPKYTNTRNKHLSDLVTILEKKMHQPTKTKTFSKKSYMFSRSFSDIIRNNVLMY